ncbi:hypothetical protein SDC9_124648 [bioreactor metagenome]|uniref:Uncharacterized protein n=1 Tax=bioreactor metagenome TaxID=1076179 RepID=A0A645CL07_9ZZZZ
MRIRSRRHFPFREAEFTVAEPERAVAVGEHQVDLSVAVEVGGGDGPAVGFGARFFGHFDEFLSAEVTPDPPLHDQVDPAVPVDVDPGYAAVPADARKSRRFGDVFKKRFRSHE